MSARKPSPCVEVEQHGVHKALSLALVRYDAFAELSLTFDRRYRRSIQLDRTQLAAFVNEGLDALAVMKPEAR